MPDQFRADFVSSSGLRIPPALEGLKVALVHDWLTGRRGGEKCLEVLVDIFPSARLFTRVQINRNSTIRSPRSLCSTS